MKVKIKEFLEWKSFVFVTTKMLLKQKREDQLTSVCD